MPKQKDLPYSCLSYLQPNERKLKLLNNTYDHLTHGSKIMFDTLIALMGGINPKMDVISENKDSEIKNNRDPQTMCATIWFRPMKSKRINKVWSPKQLKEQFLKYYQEYEADVKINDMVEAYFDSPLGENYVWVDCRKKYKQLVKELASIAKTTEANLKEDLDCDLECLFRPSEKKMKLYGSNKSWAIISNLFGEGDKEDRSKKIKILTKAIQILTESNPESYADVQKAFLAAADIDDPKKFHTQEIWGNGSPGNIVKMARGDFLGKEFDCEKILEKINDVLKEKTLDFDLKVRLSFKEYLISKIGHYYQNSWSEMINSAFADIISKNTRNVNFAKEKVQLQKTLSETSNAKVELLTDFFKSDFFLGDDKFDIAPHNLGGANGIKFFYDFCKKNEDQYFLEELLLEAAIEESVAEAKSKSLKEPHKDLLRYVFSIRKETTFEELRDAAKYIQTHKRIKNMSVHPTVKSDIGFNVTSGSALVGHVVSPSKKINGRIAGESGFIWICMKLWEGGDKWIEHHIPFTDTRFYEQIYKYNPDSKLEPVVLRTKRYGVDLTKFNLPPMKTDLKHVAPKEKNKHNYVKVQRRLQRLNHPDVPNTIWPKSNIGFTIRRKNGKYILNVVHKLPKNKVKKSVKPKFGDILIGVDQNQTTNHTCSIYKVVKKNTKEALLVPESDFYLKKIETIKVTSFTKARYNSEPIDQLHYEGISVDNEVFKNWCKDREQFVDSLSIKEFKNEFKRIKNKNENLYSFNADYLWLLKRIISGKLNKKKFDVSVFEKSIRNEILAMCSKEGLGPLRVSSLSSNSLKSIGFLKSAICSFISIALNRKGIEDKTDVQKNKIDPELFDLIGKIEQKRVNKRMEKTRRNADFILTMAVDYQKSSQKNVFLFCEGNLETAKTGNSKKRNSANVDWCSRKLFDFLKEKSLRHGIYFHAVTPHYTSHQDPFEYHPSNKVMLPRFAKFDKNNPIQDWAEKKYLGFANSDPESGTALYYKKGVENFFAHYQKGFKEKVELAEMKNVLNSNLKNGNLEHVFCPIRGGRYYLSTHPVTSDAKPFEFNGRKCYICDSDEVAATNIMLIGLFYV